MTLESSLWTNFKSALPMEAHAVRIENGVEVGTPDVNMCLPIGAWSAPWDGWVELKVQIPPKRRKTLFRCSHFTMEQRTWLADRVRAGGRAYLLMQVDAIGGHAIPGLGKYLWIRGDIAAVWIDHCTLTELLEKCDWVGDRLIDLVEYLRS